LSKFRIPIDKTIFLYQVAREEFATSSRACGQITGALQITGKFFVKALKNARKEGAKALLLGKEKC
jgi:hypothetical protein